MRRAKGNSRFRDGLLRAAALAACCVPLLLEAPYLAEAWRSSPADRVREEIWGAAALALLAGAVAVRRYVQPRPRAWAWWFAVPAAAAYSYGFHAGLNAVQVVAGVAVAWIAAWALYGGKFALLLLPGAACAVVAAPGSANWLGKARTFVAAPAGEAYAPRFTRNSQRGWLGRESAPTETQKAAFRTSLAEVADYTTPTSAVNALTVRAGKANEIHPAAHCLRSAGWKVVSERLVSEEIAGKAGKLEAAETVAERGGARIVAWTWYSGPEKETGSFLLFRRLHRPEEEWTCYQLASAAPGEGGVERARSAIRHLLESGGGGK